jgi:hypothetical protein
MAGARRKHLMNGVVAVIGAHMAVNVQKPHEMSALIDAPTRKFRSQLLLGTMLRGEAASGARSSPEESAERRRVSLFELLGPLDA